MYRNLLKRYFSHFSFEACESCKSENYKDGITWKYFKRKTIPLVLDCVFFITLSPEDQASTDVLCLCLKITVAIIVQTQSHLFSILSDFK